MVGRDEKTGCKVDFLEADEAADREEDVFVISLIPGATTKTYYVYAHLKPPGPSCPDTEKAHERWWKRCKAMYDGGLIKVTDDARIDDVDSVAEDFCRKKHVSRYVIIDDPRDEARG